MDLKSILKEIDKLDLNDFFEVWRHVTDDLPHRQLHAEIEDEILLNATKQWRESYPEQVPADGSPWKQPIHWVEGYLPGETVEHHGNMWESVHPGVNVWEPSEETHPHVWMQKNVNPSIPKWQEGLEVQVGERFRHAGHVFEVVEAHTTHSGALPTDPEFNYLWKEIR